jgi:adenylate kinase
LTLIGPPGSGKGTQAAALAARLGVPVVSTGQLIRDHGGDGGALDQWRSRAERGELVPDTVILTALHEVLGSTETSRGYVLDGFPRTIAQAEDPAGPHVDVAVRLDVPDEVVRERLASRRAAGRTDDDPEAVERRLQVYHSETEPVADMYRKKGTLRSVDATRPPGEVTEAILDALGD